MPGNRVVYENAVRPAFTREHERAPANGKHVRGSTK